MKKILLTIAIALTVFATTYAQDGKAELTPEQKAEKSSVKLQKSLSLTPDQKKKVYTIELERFKTSQEWHKKTSADKKAQKMQHDAFKKENENKLDQVFTAEQKKKRLDLGDKKKDKKDKKKGKSEDKD